MGREFVDRMLCDMAIAGDLAAIDGEQRCTLVAIQVDAIAARRCLRLARSVLDQRPHPRIGPHDVGGGDLRPKIQRSEEHTSELQSLMRTSYAVFCLQKKNYNTQSTNCNLS